MFLILETPARVVKPCWSPGQWERQAGECWSHATLVGCSCVPWMLTGPLPGKLLFAPAADSAVADPFVGSTATAKFHWLFLGLFCPSHLVYLPLEEREIYRLLLGVPGDRNCFIPHKVRVWGASSALCNSPVTCGGTSAESV